MNNKCLYCYESMNVEQDYHLRCSMKFFGAPSPPLIEYSLNQMEVLAKKTIEQSVSVPGVQPKLSMSIVKEATEAKTRLTIVGALGGNYIFKPPSTHFAEMPSNEHLTMRIAEAFGVKVVPSALIRLASGELSYITKRIDRLENGEKVHMIDMFQITEAFDKYKSSMEKIGKALNEYSDNTLLDKILFFELALFSFLTGNNDMHLKNFSMKESPSGWILSPAYDLLNVAVVFPEDTEELALTLVGKKKKLKKIHFEEFGKGMGLSDKQIQSTFKRMLTNKSKAMEWVNRSFLSKTMKIAYKNLLERQYKQLDLIE